MDVSIIICTCNRAQSLQKTLESLRGVEVRAGLQVEILIIDNGSTDGTRAVVEGHTFPQMECHYLLEPSPGKVKALNAGLAAARGNVILFLDDDIRPARGWLEHMTGPLMEGQCEGVVGKIELDPGLVRPWMAPVHRLWLAAPVELCGGVADLIGANMGIHRSVLDRVPMFDPALGPPGALGYLEDSLFSWQVREAGLRIHHVPEAVATHFPDASRLLRSNWLASARGRGRSEAYVFHHWLHGDLKCARLRAWYLAAKLFLRRRVQPPPRLNEEGVPPWEISYVYRLEMCRYLVKERTQPRNYLKRGLSRHDLSAQRRKTVPASNPASAR